MFEIIGKYNKAAIMLPDEGFLEATTKSQIYNFLNHPAFADSSLAIMPDCHAGMGAVVGFTMTMNSYVIPNVVGVDLGCGMSAFKLEGIKSINWPEFDKAVSRIPHGFSRHPIDTDGNDKPYQRNQRLLEKHFGEMLHLLSDKIGTKYEDVIASLGTLGGGNHFIEVDVDSQGVYWLVIHSGSRNFGLKVANYHQAKAKELMKQIYGGGDAYKMLEFLPLDNGGAEYIADMRLAQSYAALNRQVMAHTLIHYYFKADMDDFAQVHSIHNYISPTDNIIRKGAISALAGEELLIPLNMRDGIILGTGKGNGTWNNSAPHGAGRNFSRSKAKQTFGMEEFKKSMEGIYTSCVNSNTIDESPMAYKDKDIIINAIADTVDIKDMLRPVYNFKAGED